MVGILDSFWDGPISAAMLVSGRVFVEVLKDSRGRKVGNGYDAKQGAVANSFATLNAWSSAP